MPRRDVLAVLILYGVALVGGTVLWVALFHTPLLERSVFFYRGLILLGIATVATAIVLVALARTRYRGLIGVRDVALVVTLLLSVNIVFFTHVPVTADRSISVFMLAYLNRAPAPLSSEQIADGVVSRYIVDNGAVDKRLNEQLVTGTLVQAGDRYSISDEGRTLVSFYELISRLFNIDPANLSP